MDQDDLLRRLVSALEQAGVHYLITGSTATMFYGEPRFTNDIDVIVQLREEHLARLLAAFPDEEFYVSEEAAGGSDKHLRDIAGVLKISGDLIDFDYLDAWAERLEVMDLWRRVRERTER